MESFSLILPHDRILLGLSGGKDSWACLELLRALARRAPIRFEVHGATVDPGFPVRVQAVIEPFGGVVTFIALAVSPEEQERRIVQPSRAAFGKLQSVDLLRRLRAEFDASLAAMPPAALTIDTEACPPSQAAERIAAHLAGR